MLLQHTREKTYTHTQYVIGSIAKTKISHVHSVKCCMSTCVQVKTKISLELYNEFSDFRPKKRPILRYTYTYTYDTSCKTKNIGSLSIGKN